MSETLFLQFLIRCMSSLYALKSDFNDMAWLAILSGQMGQLPGRSIHLHCTISPGKSLLVGIVTVAFARDGEKG